MTEKGGNTRLQARLRHCRERYAQLEDQLCIAQENLQDFAYAVSHDLQEPLRMVRSYLQLVARRYKDALDQDATDFIEYAVDGASRMQSMIQDLLKYSRVYSRGGAFEDINCKEIVSLVLDKFKLRVEDLGGSIEVGDLPVIRADPKQLITVFSQLIDNAVKFRGEVPPRIEISRDIIAGEEVILVRDNGIGISSRDQARVFKVFEKVHARNTYPGNGMGLALVKRILTRHGCRIGLRSEPGKGSTFYFTLPAPVPKETLNTKHASIPEGGEQK